MSTASFDIDPGSSGAPAGFGLPDERLAQAAARRAFAEMKAVFLRAAAHIPGPTGTLLLDQVRQASEAVELWRLRASIFAGLPQGDDETISLGMELRRQLDNVFPESDLPATLFRL
jgi:hypothetical protein